MIGRKAIIFVDILGCPRFWKHSLFIPGQIYLSQEKNVYPRTNQYIPGMISFNAG
jgi:hypothetical protein